MDMKLHLPTVTLACIETRQHVLAKMAIEDCLEKAEFGDVLVFTDKVGEFLGIHARIIEVPDWPDKLGWSQWFWSGMAPYLETSHVLNIQWDSWIVNPEAWKREFLDYSYIGSPWWYTDGRNVGNGGFSIRSTRLCRYLRTHLAEFPCTTALDDDLLCRKYRPKLEERGFVWAPESVAGHFAFECVKPDNPTFGYHAMHNWHYVLSWDELLRRAKIAQKSNYVTHNSWMWSKLMERNPQLAKELDFVPLSA